ncbi:hypothetical protein [Geotalea sp. SG265]|uniref:hypothetical protein n=1 Tax=Geotalea sp. SG265 TaxID=2922867 RepID=UPI001FAF4438|nr:hypothetical protein [Geotalea sp. SG265]
MAKAIPPPSLHRAMNSPGIIGTVHFTLSAFDRHTGGADALTQVQPWRRPVTPTAKASSVSDRPTLHG